MPISRLIGVAAAVAPAPWQLQVSGRCALWAPAPRTGCPSTSSTRSRAKPRWHFVHRPPPLSEISAAQASKVPRAAGRARANADDLVARVDAYLLRVGGVAKIAALRKAVLGVPCGFLEKHFDVNEDGLVLSRSRMALQTRNVAAYLRARRGVAPASEILSSFPVTRQWLERSTAFNLVGEVIQLANPSDFQKRAPARPRVSVWDAGAQSAWDIGIGKARRPSLRGWPGEAASRPAAVVKVTDEELQQLSPSALLRVSDTASAKLKLDRWLRSRAALPNKDQRNAIKRLMALWHPDLARAGQTRRSATDVFRFLANKLAAFRLGADARGGDEA